MSTSAPTTPRKSRPSAAAAAALFADPRLTSFGLLAETSSAMLAAVAPQIEGHGIAASEFEVLIRLARTPDHRLRMSDLAAQAMLSASGLTRLIDRLNAAGLVIRESCPSDRRGSYAVLTKQGIRLVHDILPGHLETIEQSLTGVLDAEERAAFELTLRKLRDVVRPDAEAGATGEPS